MTQTHPLSWLAKSAADDLSEFVSDALDDGRFDDQEVTVLRTHVRLVVVRTEEVDDAQSLSVAALRGGPDCYRAALLFRQMEARGTSNDQDAA